LDGKCYDVCMVSFERNRRRDMNLQGFTDEELDDWRCMSTILFGHYGTLRQNEGSSFPPCDKRRQKIVQDLIYSIWQEQKRRRGE